MGSRNSAWGGPQSMGFKQSICAFAATVRNFSVPNILTTQQKMI